MSGDRWRAKLVANAGLHPQGGDGYAEDLVRLAFHSAGSLGHGGRIVTGFWLSPVIQPAAPALTRPVQISSDGQA